MPTFKIFVTTPDAEPKLAAYATASDAPTAKSQALAQLKLKDNQDIDCQPLNEGEEIDPGIKFLSAAKSAPVNNEPKL